MSSKKILIIDESKTCVEKLSILFKAFTSSEIDVIDSYDKATQFFNTYEYEFVIIDHNCKSANPFMEYVLTEKQSQKVILLSDSLNCPIDCQSCLNTFKFVRLLKPINYQELLSYVQGKALFDCPNQYRFSSIDTIEKLYEFINLSNNVAFVQKFIENDKLIIKAKSPSLVNVDELLKIEDMINPTYFKHKLDANYDIIISQV